MSLIDWSDPDEMLGLLVEYVTDEAVASFDADRAEFLRSLVSELENLAGQDFASVDQIADALREIRGSQPGEFLTDGVIAHVDACIEELHRIGIGLEKTRTGAV